MKFNMSSYLKTLKQGCKCPTMADELFVLEAFDPFVTAGSLKNKNKEEFALDKHRVSKLMAGQIDVPSAMRKRKIDERLFTDTLEGFEIFSEGVLGLANLATIREELWKIISSDNELPENEKSQLIEGNPDDINFLLRAFFLAVYTNNLFATPKNNVVWSRGDSSLRVVPGNIMTKAFPKNNTAKDIIVVIPVNTSFETTLSENSGTGIQLVSENTLHGKWLAYFASLRSQNVNRDVLDRAIHESLTAQGVSITHASKSTLGKRSCYPIGTIATYRYRRSIFYLWAISEFDEKNRAQSTEDDIKVALDSLIEFYDSYGQGADLYMPLVGTGRSRANMTHQESYTLIKQMVLENERKIHGNISIVVLPEDYEKIKIF